MIQEINRAFDQPSMVAEYLIDRAAFGDHPLGRTVLGPEENLRSFTREGIVAFRERRWAGARGGAFLVGNVEHLPQEAELQELFGRFPALPVPDPYDAAPDFEPEKLVEQRDTNQSHLRMIYRPDVAVTDVRERAALAIYSTLLGGSMGSRLFDEIREKRGLCYSVYAINHAFADVPILQLGSGLESAKCIEAYTRMREIVDELRDDGPTEEEVPARPRLRRRPARALLREHQRRRALRRQPADRLRRADRPRRGDRRARRRHVRRGARGGRRRRGQARGRLCGAALGRGVLICRAVCQVGVFDRVRLTGGMGWSGERDAGLGVGVASLMMRGLDTPGPGFVLPACAV